MDGKLANYKEDYPLDYPLSLKMLISNANPLLLQYQLVALFFKTKYKELKVQEPSHSNVPHCYQSLTFNRQKLLNLLYYYQTIEYPNIRKDLLFESDIPTLTLPNLQVKK